MPIFLVIVIVIVNYPTLVCCAERRQAYAHIATLYDIDILNLRVRVLYRFSLCLDVM